MTPFKALPARVASTLRESFPIVKWLPKYPWREALPQDLVAGMTLATVVLPQAMGYGMLAGLPPVYGLYCSVLPPLLYALVGMSEFVSVGTYAVMSLMMADAMSDLCESVFGLESRADAVDSDPLYVRFAPVFLPLTLLVTFLMGCGQLALAVVRAGRLADVLLTDSFIDAFAAGSAVHVVTSQLGPFFGVSMSAARGVFALPRTWVQFFAALGAFQPATFALALASLISMYLIGLVEDAVARHRGRVPGRRAVPAILISVIAFTLLSAALGLPARSGIRTAGAVARGLPPVVVPWAPAVAADGTEVSLVAPLFASISAILQLAGALVPLLLITFVSTYAVARVFPSRILPVGSPAHEALPLSPASEFGGEPLGKPIAQIALEPNQAAPPFANHELFSLGFCTLIGAFFSSYAPAGSLSRSSMLCEHCTTRSQFASVASVAVSLTMLLCLPGFLEQIPLAILSAVVVKTIVGVLQKAARGITLWRQALAARVAARSVAAGPSGVPAALALAPPSAGQSRWLFALHQVLLLHHALTWTATFFAVLLLSVALGCLVGVAFTAVFHLLERFYLRRVSSDAPYASYSTLPDPSSPSALPASAVFPRSDIE